MKTVYDGLQVWFHLPSAAAADSWPDESIAAAGTLISCARAGAVIALHAISRALKKTYEQCRAIVWTSSRMVM
jgi:hypothetical protein